MDWIRPAVAVLIVAVWAFVVLQATKRPAELTTLVTVTTPVMLLPAGYLFAGGVLRRGRQQLADMIAPKREEDDDGVESR